MVTSHLWRLFSLPLQRLTVRSIGNVAHEPNLQQYHLYKKIYTEPELIKYVTDNVVYNSGDHIVTSVPQGIELSNKNKWKESDRDDVSNTTLRDIIPTLCCTFNSEHLFMSKYPGRNASGLLILSKKKEAFKLLQHHFQTAEGNLNRIYTYLAVVLGSPSKKFEKVFKVEQFRDNQSSSTLILDDFEEKSKKTVKTSYEHKVIDSINKMSLVKITVSYDLKDCVRYILTQKCFTPVFGDSWCAKRSVDFLFGAPLASDPATRKLKPYELDQKILEKLHLNLNELNTIPIHSHLFRLKLSMKHNTEFFVSVPPPENFVWTCKQLGLNGIELFAMCPSENQLT